MSFNEYVQIIGATTAALLGVAAVVSTLIWRPMKANMKRDLENMLDERLAPIEKATAQLLTNGGSHLADRVIRLEERQSGIATRLDDIFDMVKTLAAKDK